MAELNIEEARKIYKHDELKAMMLAKFSKEELEKHEVTQEEFDKTFLELLGQCTKTVFLDEQGNKSDLPTNRIELSNADGKWLFDIQFTGKGKHFWVNYIMVWKIFMDKYDLQGVDIQRLMKNQVVNRFGLNDATPAVLNAECPITVVNRFGLNDATPTKANTLDELRW